MGDGGESPRNEEERELEHRRLIELLNELRVALTGVQIMFAFLLTVPFTQRFAQVTNFQRYVYFITLLCAAVSVALLIAPSAHHRILFRRHQKHRLVAANHERNAPKGTIDPDEFRQLVSLGLTRAELAAKLEISATTVSYWLRKLRLRTKGGVLVVETQLAREAGLRALRRHCR